jgi:hypothetical protein
MAQSELPADSGESSGSGLSAGNCTPDELDPDSNSTMFHCRLCDFSNSSRRSVVTHINRQSDAKHEDRSATEDPTLVEVEGNELLKEWNAREDFEGEEKVTYDQKDYKILYYIWLDPDATQEEIGNKVDLCGVSVSNRLNSMGVGWKDRMKKVEKLFPISAPGDESTSGSKPATDDELLEEIRRLAKELGEKPTSRDMDEKGKYHNTTYQRRFDSWSAAVDEAELDDLDLEDEQVSLSYGNRSYEGPSKGINLAEDDSGLSPTQQARARLESFEALPSKQQAVIISAIVHGSDASDEEITTAAGAPDLDSTSLPRTASAVGKALGKHIVNDRATIGDLFRRFHDDHDHDLEELLDEKGVSRVPLHPYDPKEPKDSQQEDDHTASSVSSTSTSVESEGKEVDDSITLSLSQDEVFQLLTQSDGPEPVLRQIFDSVSSSPN